MKAEFIISAARPDQFIHDDKPKIIFAGRSNVGKSSVINTLTGRKNLARVGNAPGKTIHANYFLIDDRFYLVDLPGYGYAKVSHAEKERWGQLMEAFFALPEHIHLSCQVVDIRHKPTAQDVQMAQYFQQLCLPWMVLANKCDKLKPSQIDASLSVIRESLTLDESVPLIPYSGEKGIGRDIAINHILTKVESSCSTNT